MGKRVIIKGADFSEHPVEFDGLLEAMQALLKAKGKGVVIKVAANSTVQIGYDKIYIGGIENSHRIVDVVNDRNIDYWYFAATPVGITSTLCLFQGQTNLVEVKHVHIPDGHNTYGMFNACTNLKRVDLTDGCFDNATDLRNICLNCRALESFKARMGTILNSVEYAFKETYALKKFEITANFDNVTNTTHYLYRTGLETVDVSMFHNVTNWSQVINYSTLKTLKVADGLFPGIEVWTNTRLANLEGNFTFGKMNVSFSNNPLTLESARKVINGLPQLESGESYTITLLKATKNILTQDDKDAISAKGWVLA